MRELETAVHNLFAATIAQATAQAIAQAVAQTLPQALSQGGPVFVSVLALLLSLANLYLQRRDRRPRLEVRARYEYRIGDSGPQLHEESQERLSVLLGDFLREHGLDYPQGLPVVHFSLSNRGEREIYLETLRLTVRDAAGRRRWVLDPTTNKLLEPELAEGSANVLARGRRPVELVPGDGKGYRFELIRLANTLSDAGYIGNVRLALEATDRLGYRFRRPFEVNVDLWAYHDDAASA